MTLPVNPELIAGLAHTLKVARSAPTSVAMYELVKRNPVPQYAFVGAVDPEEMPFFA